MFRDIGSRFVHWIEWVLFRTAHAGSRSSAAALIGGTLIAIASLFWFVLEPRVSSETARVEAALVRDQAIKPVAVIAVDELKELAEQLESPFNRSMMGNDVFAAFGARTVRVEQVNFSKETLEESGEDVRSVRVQTTVVGLYPAVKGGIRELMKQHPSLAIESMAITRNGASDKNVTADLAFVFWYRRH